MFTISHRYNRCIFYLDNQKVDPAIFFHCRKQPECFVRDDREGEDHSWQDLSDPKIFDWLLERNFIHTNTFTRHPLGIRSWMVYLEEKCSSKTSSKTTYEKFYEWAILENQLDLAEYLLERI